MTDAPLGTCDNDSELHAQDHRNVLCRNWQPALPELLEKAREEFPAQRPMTEQEQANLAKFYQSQYKKVPCGGAQPELDLRLLAEEIQANALCCEQTGGRYYIDVDIVQTILENARAGSSPAPSPTTPFQHHVLCSVSNNWPIGSSGCTCDRHCRGGVTGNEGKDESRGKDIAMGGSDSSGDRAGSDGASLPEVASPAVDWLDTELWNFAHGLAIDLGVDADHQTSEAEVKIHRAMAGVAKAYHHQHTRIASPAVVTPADWESSNERSELIEGNAVLRAKISELDAQLQLARDKSEMRGEHISQLKRQ